MSDKQDSFKEKTIDILTSWRIWILLFFIFISFISLSFNFNTQGVAINGITQNSVSYDSGMSYKSEVSQSNLERILFIGYEPINSEVDFYSAIEDISPNSTISIYTNTNPKGYNLEFGNFSEDIGDVLGISVRSVPTSNVKLGIELEGGSRLILKPTQNLTDEGFDLLVNTLQGRLDVYGASGTKVNKLEDVFSNEKFVIVESINANKNDIFELIKRQGQFEAKIGNTTVFTGDNVIRVLNDPSHEVLQGCSGEATVSCSYAFSIEIDSTGTNNFFNITKDLSVVGGYLSEEISFHLDGEEITSLNIASSFKFQKISTPQITVSGSGTTQEEAIRNTKKEMRFLQAILSTQSLPSDLDVVQSYSISSSRGELLLQNAIYVGIAALLLVSSIVAIRYRNIPVFFGIFVALLTEVFIVFGAAAFLRLSIDLAAIGGLIAAIGTGVDDQIIITDEYFRNRKKSLTSRKRIKQAMYIIMIAYFTTLAAMGPLYFAGLKVLQGFAFMIIIGITIGVFITRPAYASYLRLIMTSRKQRKEEEEEDK
jgi:preprotein translocase subunit SecD